MTPNFLGPPEDHRAVLDGDGRFDGVLAELSQLVKFEVVGHLQQVQ